MCADRALYETNLAGRWVGAYAPRMRLFPLSVLLVLFAAGCAHTTAEARQLSEMNGTVEEVQKDQDKENRSFLGEGMDVNNPPSRTSAVQGGPAGTPNRTVQLDQPPDDGLSDDPNDTTARPAINVTGSGGGVVNRPSRSKSTKDSSDPLSAPLDTNGGHSSALDPDAKKAYDDAIHLVQAKNYDKALDALNGFLTKWPDHPYTENALYWKGECLYAKGEYLRAAEQFEAVVNRFGGGKKGPDALLKMGMCQDKLGASDRAHEYWDRLRRDYPNSDASKKIPAYASTRNTAGPKETR